MGDPKVTQKRCLVPLTVPPKYDKAMKGDNPTAYRHAVRKYGITVAVRLINLLFKNKPIYLFPTAGKPNLKKTALDIVPIPKNVPPELKRYIDVDGDGHVGTLILSMERDRVWRLTSKTYAALRLLQSLRQNGCDSKEFRAAIHRLQTDVKALKPLYSLLPRVDLYKQSVSVYGITFPVTSSAGIVSAVRLFSIGEGLMQMPYRIVRKFNMSRLEFGIRSITRKIYGTFNKPYFITINSKSRYNFPDGVLHEVGHYVDYQLGQRLGYKHKTLSASPMFQKEYERRLKLAFPHKGDRQLLKKLTDKFSSNKPFTKKEEAQWMKMSFHVKQYFPSHYAAKNTHERFAEAWQAYWSRGRLLLSQSSPDLYALFEKIRKGQKLTEYSKSSQRKKYHKRWELSVKLGGSMINTKIADGEKLSTINVGAELKWYHVGGLLYAKIAAGYSDHRTFINTTGDEETHTSKHLGYASLGYGIHVGHTLEGFFKGGSLDVSGGIFMPTWKPYFNAELMFPKLRVNFTKKVALDMGPAFGVQVFETEKKGVIASPYFTLSVGVVF